MELVDRARIETAYGKRFTSLAERHRRELDRLLGNPPDAANVPVSFWEKVQRETEEETLALLLFIFIASATQHGLTDRNKAQDIGTSFALGRAAQVARSYAETSYERAANNFPSPSPGDEPMPAGKRNEALGKVFSPERADGVVVNETTAAQTAGGEAAVDATTGLANNDTWYTANDNRVCEICGPLHGKLRADWSRFFPSGPPAHPACRCWIVYANAKVADFTTEESMSAQLKPFDPATPREDASALVAQSVFTGASAAVASLLEGMEERMEARLFAALGRVLTEMIGQQQSGLAAIVEGVAARLLTAQQETFRMALASFTEQIIEERQKPNIIQIHMDAPVVNLPEQAEQPAPVVTVNVSPEVTLKQEPRSITLKRSGDTITGKSE